jgi:segregation and condensation protein A
VLAGELDLDLETFEGPLDLLLTLLLKEELSLAEVDVAQIVVAFAQRLAEEGRLDLEACGEFLVLVGALLELKARELFPDEETDLGELGPEQAAEELARRLEEYGRIREAALWLTERLEREQDRYFRLGPAPLRELPARTLPPQEPRALADAMRAMAAEPPAVSLSHMALRFPPIERFLERFRLLLRRRRRFVFDSDVKDLSRVEQAAAFLALLELRKGGEVALEQSTPFAPIRVSRPDLERSPTWKTAASA